MVIKFSNPQYNQSYKFLYKRNALLRLKTTIECNKCLYKCSEAIEVLHNSCNTSTRVLRDMYIRIPEGRTSRVTTIKCVLLGADLGGQRGLLTKISVAGSMHNRTKSVVFTTRGRGSR